MRFLVCGSIGDDVVEIFQKYEIKRKEIYMLAQDEVLLVA